MDESRNRSEDIYIYTKFKNRRKKSIWTAVRITILLGGIMTQRGEGTCCKAGSILCPDLGGGHAGVKYIKLFVQGLLPSLNIPRKRYVIKKLTAAWTRKVTEVTERCEQK